MTRARSISQQIQAINEEQIRLGLPVLDLTSAWANSPETVAHERELYEQALARQAAARRASKTPAAEPETAPEPSRTPEQLSLLGH